MSKIVLFVFLFLSYCGFSQWSVPSPMNQFCAGGDTLTFPNVGNGSGAGNMGQVGCLLTTPNPSWYFLQVGTPGNIEFNISQVSNTGMPIDVDFALWGPFDSIDEAIAEIQANPEGASLIDCSYAPAEEETAYIPNAQTGQIYVFLITNYDGQSGQISLTQTGGEGTTSCDFVCGVSLGDDIVTCNSTHTLSAVFNADSTDLTGVVYEWSYNETTLPETSANLMVTQSGVYSVTAQLPDCIEPATASVEVTLSHDMPQIEVANAHSCSGDFFDFTAIANQLIAQYPNENFNVSFFSSYNNAELNQNVLPLSYQAHNTQTIYVRVTNSQFEECFSIATFELVIYEYPRLTSIEDLYEMCNGEAITVNVSEVYDSYLWSDGSTNPSLLITEPGEYTITVTQNNCSTTKTFTAVASEKATIADIIIKDFSLSDNSIEIIVDGNGDYEYSMGGLYQDSNVFLGVDSGLYIVYVRDKNGCGVVTQPIQVLAYPLYFTPNQDGINDYWHVKYAYYEPKMEVFIFDRYGKLITSFRGQDLGWDGTFNGNLLPATDYWFKIKREDGREHKGHFSLVR